MLLAFAPLPIMAQNIFQGLESYYEGDYETALREFEPLAEQGWAEAQRFLGFMYSRGDGVLQDYAEAVRLYRLAAEQGNVDAQYSLGWMYFKGHGVPRDYAKEHMWYNIAATNGDNNARAQRESIEQMMNLTDIAEAQRRARVCMETDYQDCD